MPADGLEVEVGGNTDVGGVNRGSLRKWQRRAGGNDELKDAENAGGPIELDAATKLELAGLELGKDLRGKRNGSWAGGEERGKGNATFDGELGDLGLIGRTHNLGAGREGKGEDKSGEKAKKFVRHEASVVELGQCFQRHAMA